VSLSLYYRCASLIYNKELHNDNITITTLLLEVIEGIESSGIAAYFHTTDTVIYLITILNLDYQKSLKN